MLKSWHAFRPLISPAGGWTPLTPGNVVAWWRADMGVSLSGSNVTAWADQSGNSNNLTNIGEVLPTYSATGWNGAKPGITFGGGGNNYLIATSGSLTTFFNSSAALTIFMTVKATSNTNYRVYMSWDAPSVANLLQFFIDVSKKAAAGDQTANVISTNTTIDGSNCVMSYMMGSGLLDCYKDGTTEISGGSLPVNPLTLLNRFLLGTNYTAGSCFDGTFAEIVIYSSKLTTTDRDNYRSYATSVWGGV